MRIIWAICNYTHGSFLQYQKRLQASWFVVCPNYITVVKIRKNQGVIQYIQSFFRKLIFQFLIIPIFLEILPFM